MSDLNQIFNNMEIEEIPTFSMKECKISDEDAVMIRSERADEYFIELIQIINTNPPDFIKLTFLQKMASVMQNYYNLLFPNEYWTDMYDETHDIERYNLIKINMFNFINTYKNNLNQSLFLVKNIYIEIFKISDCFSEYYNL